MKLWGKKDGMNFLLQMKVTKLCPTLGNSMDYTVHGILQARILEWVAVPFSRGSSQHRDRTQVSCIAGRFFTISATREALITSEELIKKNLARSDKNWEMPGCYEQEQNIDGMKHTPPDTLVTPRSLKGTCETGRLKATSALQMR